jgi:osmotically inducible protein OsmC
MKIFYTSVATATGDGRENGHVRSSDGIIDAELAVPVERGGKGGATNALRRVGRRAQADVDGTEVTAEVGIGAAGEGAFGLAVTLRVTMPNVERARAEELVAAAHRVCPYSNATRGNIDVVLEVQ